MIEWTQIPSREGQWESWSTRVNDHYAMIMLVDKERWVLGDPVNGRYGYYLVVDFKDAMTCFSLDTPLEDVKAAAIAIARMS